MEYRAVFHPTSSTMTDVIVKSGPTGQRSNRNSGRNSGRGRTVTETGDREPESRPAREIIPSPPFPLAQLGLTVSGKICDIVKRGKGQFGFIYVGEGLHSVTPRVYFSFKEYTETKFPPRRGYLVEFECAEDASDRVFASNVRLTAAGAKEAEEREEKYLSNPDNRKDQNGERRERRQRKDEDEGRSVVLKVTCEGESETKQVTANVAQSIGKLKHAATLEFCAPIDFKVFCRITPETPEGVLLSRAILTEMSDNDVIHIKPAAVVKA